MMMLILRGRMTSEHGTYVFEESSSGQDNESEPGPSTSGNQEKLDDFDFWMDSYAIDDDELLTKKVSQELVNEMSQTVDEAKLRKVVDKCVKKFNPYARYNVEHWKNPHAKIFYIKKQKDPVVYSNSKIVQIIKTYWKLGHDHKFITEINARRANGSTVSITESDYKNLNKNHIEDMYVLIVNDKVDEYAETGVERYQPKVNLTAPTITFPSIEKYKVFSIVSEPVVLEGLKSYNNDVKHGYVTPSLSKEDVEYLKLFEEEIDERLKHRDQMRRWEMYVNGRPLGSRRERLEKSTLRGRLLGS
ncbi:hypothetical protein Tco_0298364 [Tanacetum coccineum]